jgi:ferredoxin-NADP reductase
MIEAEAKISTIIKRTYNVKSFRVQLPGSIVFQAGQFLSVTLNKGGNLKRYLSISNSPTEEGYLEFTKKITQSDFSQNLDSFKGGEMLIIRYPFGRFVLDEPQRKTAFISGGIGITPIRSICKYVVDSNLGTDIVLLYANRTFQDIAFYEDFKVMQEQYPRLKVRHVLSEGISQNDCVIGKINEAFIKEEVSDFRERKFYLCGPPQMVEAMRKILSTELNLPTTQIITENFQGY